MFFTLALEKFAKNDYCDYFRDVYCMSVRIIQLLSKGTDLCFIYMEMICDVMEQMKKWPLATEAVLHYKS